MRGCDSQFARSVFQVSARAYQQQVLAIPREGIYEDAEIIAALDWFAEVSGDPPASADVFFSEGGFPQKMHILESMNQATCPATPISRRSCSTDIGFELTNSSQFIDCIGSPGWTRNGCASV